MSFAKVFAPLVLVAVTVPLITGFFTDNHIEAADADNFYPGFLIDNDIMRDNNSMDVPGIKDFLEGSCEENHDESGKWRDFGQKYTCLRDYKEDITQDMPECTDDYIKDQFGFDSSDEEYNEAKTMCWWKGGRTNFNKNDSNTMGTDDSLGSEGKTAAFHIKQVADKHEINPQVLLVLLQKEQSIVKDVWPWIIQYQSATGFGCPDDADCDPKWRGFYNQVNEAARMFKEILEEDDSRTNWYPPGDNDVLYNPDESCGSDEINIRNLATSALYNYTPYQPNQAALDNLYGTGDSCSTYGNRNFWRDFTDWFGPPAVNYQSLDHPRPLYLPENMTKTNLYDGSTGSSTLEAGTVIDFATKASVDGTLYLRSAYDSEHDYDLGFPFSDLEELPDYQPIDDPRTLRLSRDMRKTGLLLLEGTGSTREEGLEIEFASKAKRNSTLYLRSAHDTEHRYHRGFAYDDLDELIDYQPMSKPRELWLPQDMTKTNLYDGSTGSSTLEAGTVIDFATKTTVDKVAYLRSAYDSEHGYDLGIPLSELEELPEYQTMEDPRDLRLKNDMDKTNLLTLEGTGNTQKKGTKIRFESKVKRNGTLYLRSAYDTEHGYHRGFPYADLQE